jgi:hypothetical protein
MVGVSGVVVTRLLQQWHLDVKGLVACVPRLVMDGGQGGPMHKCARGAVSSGFVTLSCTNSR